MTYSVTDEVCQYLEEHEIHRANLAFVLGKEFHNAIRFDSELKEKSGLDEKQRALVIASALQEKFIVDSLLLNKKVDAAWIGSSRFAALQKLSKKTFGYKWQFSRALVAIEQDWAFRENTKANKLFNKSIKEKRMHMFNIFKVIE